ncbi:probable arabinosyltransferase ARAD1 isoform X1 [Olea europaea var. sylvestris]|uniref:probable arabinosyltransferase ARAD1 isoform X1 n=2 Tax=Olea europaea var. sylvestris TaxID=158386 RepID=UPI000C1D1038|nr:probable arabinosyltransferase ARAD1 isoform X1 [Olea europaea var. sylvestris]
MGLIIHKSLFCFFFFTSVFFILSWFFVLSSTGRPLFDSILPNPRLLVKADTEISDETPETNVSTLKEEEESQNQNSINCDSNKQVLKVYMYDLPPEFHFELLGWTGKSIWPDIHSAVPEYAGGLNLQHSIEYWLTLDLLSSEFTENLSGKSAIRVRNSSEADVVFVPFFSSISFNRYSKLKPNQKKSTDVLLQEKLVKFLTAQDEWKRSRGRDHIILAHHPNSLLDARTKLWPAMFILADFGRYPLTIANVAKDVIAPYRHVVESYVDDLSDFDSRPTLLYFQGAIYRKDGGMIRQELFYMLKDEKDVHFSFGSIQKDGIRQATQGMRSSKFCLNIAGDTPSSNRMFDAISSHCVPVIISDEIELPFEDVLDYSEFCIFVRASDALKEKFLINFMRNIGKKEWTRMWRRLKEVENYFEYQYPSKRDDAVQMIWQAVTRKVPAIKMKLHKASRFPQTNISTEKVLFLGSLPRNFW